MPSIPDDELLSAYLDGELSGDDLARAERLLAERPESRHVLEELRALGSGLRELPRYHLPGDFSEHVLRRSEREMLAPPAPDHGAETPEALSAEQPLRLAEDEERRPARFWLRARRPLIWAGIAMAAGLMLMFFEPGARQGVEERIAQGPAADEPNDAAIAAARPEAVRRDDSADRESAGIAAKGGATASVRTAPAQAAPPEHAAEFRREELSPKAAPMPAPAGLAAPQEDTPENGARPGSGSRSEHMAGAALGKAAGPAISAGAEGSQYFAYDPGQLMVIVCEVSPESDYRHQFRAALARQNVLWDEASGPAASTSVGDESRDEVELEVAEQLSGKKAEAIRRRQALDRLADPEQQAVAGGLAEGITAESLENEMPALQLAEPEAVYVEASWDQIEAALTEVGGSDAFGKVMVEVPMVFEGEMDERKARARPQRSEALLEEDTSVLELQKADKESDDARPDEGDPAERDPAGDVPGDRVPGDRDLGSRDTGNRERQMAEMRLRGAAGQAGAEGRPGRARMFNLSPGKDAAGQTAEHEQREAGASRRSKAAEEVEREPDAARKPGRERMEKLSRGGQAGSRRAGETAPVRAVILFQESAPQASEPAQPAKESPP